METETTQPQGQTVEVGAVPSIRRIGSAFGTAVPVAIIVLGILLLQCHSLRFWEMAVGPWVGWGWSILLELISLWLWYRPESGVVAWWAWRAVALTTTALLLTGPLYQVSAPLFAESVKEQALDLQIARAERSLETYQENSRRRAGWQSKIDQTEAELARLWSQRWKGGLGNGQQAAAQLDWQRRAIIVLQVVSILVVQAAVVLAITTVSSIGRPAVGEMQAIVESATARLGRPVVPPTTLASPDRLVASLQEAERRRLASGQSYAEIEEQTGIQKPYLSLLMNHFERAKRGDRVLGKDALHRLEQRLANS